MFLRLWKFLAMIITQKSGAFSFIRPKVCLKLVPLHNGKKFPSVPLAHAVNMKEIYESMKLIFGKIKYDEFKLKLYGDLKVVALLL